MSCSFPLLWQSCSGLFSHAGSSGLCFPFSLHTTCISAPKSQCLFRVSEVGNHLSFTISELGCVAAAPRRGRSLTAGSSGHSQLDPAVPWIRRCSPFPARCPPSWHICDPPQLTGSPTPPCCLLLLRWSPTSCREQHSIELSWPTPCQSSVCHMCTWGGKKEIRKRPETALLEMDELNLIFDCLTG